MVLSTGDTVHGEIENAFWEEPPSTIRFRTTATARPTSYKARQLRSLYLSSGRLLRHELLPLDRAAEVRFDHLSPKLERRQQPDSVLADVLVLGPATLLGAVLNENNHFFVKRPGEPYIEMTGRRYLLTKQRLTQVMDANDYKSQLLRYFGDCEAATNLLDQSTFTEESLRRIVTAFNRQCTDAPVSAQDTTLLHDDQTIRPRVALRVGAVAGVRYNSLRFTAPPQTSGPLQDLNADGRFHPQVGLYADVVNSGRHLALHSALSITQFGTSQPIQYTTVGQYHWRGTQIAGQFGLRGFIRLGGPYHLLVGGGYELNFFWAAKSYINDAYNQYDFIDRFQGSPLPYIETGLQRRRFSILWNGRLYEKDGFSQPASTASYNFRPWSLSVSIGYRLNADTDEQHVPKP
ncbi:hypothetical protein MUN82_09600 [Hymenobacter aerilatus]|uniref:Uncharacterized protein n=1 Tax=Hymenobacter aerilatus TaxID=2932251 RepID=A0A8T9SZN5_9BACT|nr:hypothetical protein [Hymenobacter aerilatus]UOR07335.1 hypothetical protein MUN82_09600 [Hymenobacter aerilatus]